MEVGGEGVEKRTHEGRCGLLSQRNELERASDGRGVLTDGFICELAGGPSAESPADGSPLASGRRRTSRQTHASFSALRWASMQGMTRVRTYDWAGCGGTGVRTGVPAGGRGHWRRGTGGSGGERVAGVVHIGNKRKSAVVRRAAGRGIGGIGRVALSEG